MRDIFEPRGEPAKSIYQVFQTEAVRRKGRPLDEWIQAGRDAVFRECVNQAKKARAACTDTGRGTRGGALRSRIGRLRREMGLPAGPSNETDRRARGLK